MNTTDSLEMTMLAMLIATNPERMTNATLAARCGLSATKLSRYTSGECNLADAPETADLLALHLGLDLDDMEATRRYLSERAPKEAIRKALRAAFMPKSKKKAKK